MQLPEQYRFNDNKLCDFSVVVKLRTLQRILAINEAVLLHSKLKCVISLKTEVTSCIALVVQHYNS